MAMDESKKRKAGNQNDSPDVSKDDLKPLIETLTKEQLMDLLQDAALRHADVLKALRKKADGDALARKIFVRGLGWDTKTESLRKVFSKFGKIEDVVVVIDKKTQRGRGYGFVTYVHLDSALSAMKEPNKTVEGRTTTCNPAVDGVEHAKISLEDVTHRKIYVGSVPEDMAAEKLHKFFSQYGEISEGPLGYEKSGKSKGYALIVFKTLEGAKQALQEPLKVIDGYKLRCKPADIKAKEVSDSKEVAVSPPAFVASSGVGALGAYGGLPYLPFDPSFLPAGAALNPGLANVLGNPFAQSFKSFANLPAFGLGAAHGLQPAAGSLGFTSLGASGGLAAYPAAQLAAYARLASAQYDAGNSSALPAGTNPGSAVASYLGATSAERAQIAGALGSLAAYYDR